MIMEIADSTTGEIWFNWKLYCLSMKHTIWVFAFIYAVVKSVEHCLIALLSDSQLKNI